MPRTETARRKYRRYCARYAGDLGNVHGIGELAVYDITRRIGDSLGLRPKRESTFMLERVREPWPWGPDYSVPKTHLPQAFSALTSAGIEDFLCIYQADIRRLIAAPRS